VQVAHADIYTWVDASGATNVSNLAPPEGVRITKILHASAPATVAREDAARQAEAQALAARVRQLEDEVDMARRQVPPAMEYRALPPPPPLIQYVIEPAPPLVQYATINMGPPANPGCDPSWMGCGPWWFPGFYPASVVVLGAPNFRPVHPIRGGRTFAVQQPVRAPMDFRRG
jgi:hypothetical protein